MRRLSTFGAVILALGVSPAFGATERSVSICAVGDMMFGRYLPSPKRPVYKPVTASKEPFAGVALLGECDVAFGNLETPVLPEPLSFSIKRTLTFRADPSAATTLAHAGFDVLSLANNHMANFGPAGAVQTRTTLESAGIGAVGAGKNLEEASAPLVVERNGVRVAFLALTVWDNFEVQVDEHGAVNYRPWREYLPYAQQAIADIRAVQNPELLVVSLHWGREYMRQPTPAQRKHAHLLIDAGADVIVGHHPHVVQPIERYKNGIIAYSLGNFLFDQKTRRAKQSLILKMTWQLPVGGNTSVQTEAFPVRLGADHLPSAGKGRRFSSPSFSLY